jgi:hypothetical protein
MNRLARHSRHPGFPAEWGLARFENHVSANFRGYLLAEPTATLKPEEVKRLMEDEYGYGFRSFKKYTDKKWEDFGVATR